MMALLRLKMDIFVLTISSHCNNYYYKLLRLHYLYFVCFFYKKKTKNKCKCSVQASQSVVSAQKRRRQRVYISNFPI